MQEIPVKYVWNSNDVQFELGTKLPEYETEGSSGADIRACVPYPADLLPGRATVVPTNLRVAIPDGYEIQIRPRSGLAMKGIMVFNSPGTIDSDYRGHLQVILYNAGKEPFTIKNEDRIAQVVLCPVCRIKWEAVDSLDDTERGEGGFGHTGV